MNTIGPWGLSAKLGAFSRTSLRMNKASYNKKNSLAIFNYVSFYLIVKNDFEIKNIR